MSRIVRVWGFADTYALEFTPVVINQYGDIRWEANVPPDLSDGQYATELYAMNKAGKQAMWTGILYMQSGQCRIVLRRERFIAWLLSPCLSFDLAPNVEFILIGGNTQCRLCLKV